MDHNDAIRIYDHEHANPTADGVPMLIRATQWMARQYRLLASEGLTRNVADRFDDWKHTRVGRRIIDEIGIANAWETFKCGGCWCHPDKKTDTTLG
jgi:hypothetical protein